MDAVFLMCYACDSVRMLACWGEAYEEEITLVKREKNGDYYGDTKVWLQIF